MSDKIPYYRRYHGYDYTKGASLFITMATEPRRALFGKVENAAVALSDFGRSSRRPKPPQPRRPATS